MIEFAKKPSLPANQQNMWQYKVGDALYGPFSSEEMQAWSEQGFFGPGISFREFDDLTDEHDKFIEFADRPNFRFLS